jgi:hypothetical protein
MFILCLHDGNIIPARTCKVLNGTIHALANNGLACRILISEIKQAFQLDPTVTLAVEELAQHTNLAAALISLEAALDEYKKAHPDDPLVTGQNSAVIFGSAALTLGLSPERTSEDIDVALSPEFLEWAQDHWPDKGHIQMDLTDQLIFAHAGDWRNRTSHLQGQTYRFQILHPYDVVLQKLLRRDPDRFQQKDIPDIEAILGKLHPSDKTLERLLTENYTRYLEDPRDHVQPTGYESVMANTRWFLSKYLPEQTLEQIIDSAYRRQSQALASARLHTISVERQTINLHDVLPVKAIKLS